ncbi:MAG: class I SAM-dependent methyltransferase [Cyanobacteria bacterium P01_D01_bin.156]
MKDFYDRLAPFYHIIYKDWNTTVETQATQLSNIIHEYWGEQVQNILDVSCGIGTQALGLASKGYNVTASDLSPKEIERAKEEAQLRNLNIHFSECDMREAYSHHQSEFDVVISCDNSIPHLLSDEEILKALKQIYACTRIGGGCLLTMRDYDKEERGTGIVKSYGIREDAGKRYFVFQVWDFEGDIYDVSMYFIEENQQSSNANTYIMRSRYYALSPNRLLQLMEEAGYTSVNRLDNRFFQPVLVGTRAT